MQIRCCADAVLAGACLKAYNEIQKDLTKPKRLAHSKFHPEHSEGSYSKFKIIL